MDASQEIDASDDLAQRCEEVLRSAAQYREYVRYRHVLEGHSVAKTYRDGDLSVVLYVDTRNKVNMPRIAASGPTAESLHYFAILVYHAKTGYPGVVSDCQNQFLLVRDVEPVKTIDGPVPPS